MAQCPIADDAVKRYQHRAGVLLKMEEERMKAVVEKRGGLPSTLEGSTTTCHELQSSPSYAQLREKLDAFAAGRMAADAVIPGACDADAFTP